jgi:hypothetical protein
MSSEPLTTTPADASAADSAERGMLLVILLMVLVGTTAMIVIS